LYKTKTKEENPSVLLFKLVESSSLMLYLLLSSLAMNLVFGRGPLVK